MKNVHCISERLDRIRWRKRDRILRDCFDRLLMSYWSSESIDRRRKRDGRGMGGLDLDRVHIPSEFSSDRCQLISSIHGGDRLANWK